MATWIDRTMQSKHIEGVCVHFEVTKSGKESGAFMSLQAIHSRLPIALTVTASLSGDSGRSRYGLAEGEDEDDAVAAVLAIGCSLDEVLLCLISEILVPVFSRSKSAKFRIDAGVG